MTLFDNLPRNAIVIATTTTLVIVASLFFLNSNPKRKKVKNVLTRESFINNRNLSWFQLAPVEDDNQDNSEQLHPEGPNIGYNSNSSWFDNKQTNDSDNIQSLTKGEKLLVVLVGLPNSGKTLIARKISRYLRWISYRTRAFSIAKYRLDRIGSKSAEFFDPHNSANYQKRISVMTEALDDAVKYLDKGGDVAILDGTNITRDRRKIINDKISSMRDKDKRYDILWIESSSVRAEDVSDQQFDELKNSPDFLDKDDYIRKTALYRDSYEPLEEEEGSFIKVFDDGRKLTLHKINGFLRTKIVSFVMNLQRTNPPIYICRHGESEFNLKGLLGGDSALSERGVLFGKALNEFLFTDELPKSARGELSVWTSNMRRAKDTAKEVKAANHVEWRSLREIEVGVCDGLSNEQMKQKFPEEHKARIQNKLTYRFPRGESYMDVISRLEPIIFEIEKQANTLLIVSHESVLRCLYAYFLDLPAEEIPYLRMPLHTLIRIETRTYGCKEKRMKIVMEGDPDE